MVRIEFLNGTKNAMNEAKSGEKGFTRSLTKTKTVLWNKYIELCNKEAEISTIHSDLEDGLNLRSNRLSLEYDVLSRRSKILQQLMRKFNENMGRLKFDHFSEDRRLTQELDALEEKLKEIKERQAEVSERMRPLNVQVQEMAEVERNEELVAHLTRDIAVQKAKIKDVEYRSIDLIESMIYMQKSLVTRKRKMVVDLSGFAQATLKTIANMRVRQSQQVSALKVMVAERQRIQREKRQLLAKRKKENVEWEKLIAMKRELDRKADILEKCSCAIDRGFTMIREKEVAPSENEDINLALLGIVQQQISNREGEDSMNSFIDWNDAQIPVETPGSELVTTLLAAVKDNKNLKQAIANIEADLAVMDRKNRSRQRKLVFATSSLGHSTSELIALRNETYVRESQNFQNLHLRNDALFDAIEEKRRSIAQRKEALKTRMDQLITLISCYNIEITGWHQSLRRYCTLV